MKKFVDDSHDLSTPSDDDESEEFDDYGTPHHQEEIARKYQEQSIKYNPKKSQTSHEIVHHEIHELPTPTTSSPSKCAGSCLDRQAKETEALDAFKKTLLMKLGIERPPNVTKTHSVPEHILETLCKKMNMPIEYCTNKQPNYRNYEYQSDDPNSFGHDQIIEQTEDVQYNAVENRIYAFPKSASKARHKNYLKFTFDESQENNNAVVHASLNIFLNSRKFLNSKNIPNDLTAIDIEIHQTLETGRHTALFEVFPNYTIPETGDGQYLQLNVTTLVSKWFHSHNTTHGIVIKVKSSVDGSALSHNFVSLDGGNNLKRPYLDILPRDQRKRRTKRSHLICPKDSTEHRCCRHPLTVDFEKFGWDWIIAPKRYDANYCAGECQIAFMQKYAHTHVVQLSTAANPCCSPRKMSSMQLLYFDANLNIILGTIPHMIVEDCFCS
ncbi:growth/differentiation factor 8 [Chironomus tepperi]|uniref:growth/differentiation factor 8 n=1 Tax=Chironomus tepperi TaxID=113505 RepID=UPI00391F6F69